MISGEKFAWKEKYWLLQENGKLEDLKDGKLQVKVKKLHFESKKTLVHIVAPWEQSGEAGEGKS